MYDFKMFVLNFMFEKKFICIFFLNFQSVGGMPQGPPPGSFVGHGPIDLSKQTPPIHQPTHHAIPPGWPHIFHLFNCLCVGAMFTNKNLEKVSMILPV